MTPTTPAEARRLQANEISAVRNVKLTPGGIVELLNISATGALVETRHRLATGTSVLMSIDGERPQQLQGSVVRSTVTAIHRDSTMTYQLAVSFNPDSKFLGLPDELEPAPAAETSLPVTTPATPAPAVAAPLVNEW
jgi:PilZ domain